MDRVGIAVRKPILHIMRRFYSLTGIQISNPPLPVIGSNVSVTGEPEFGEFEPPVVLARYGELPQEFM